MQQSYFSKLKDVTKRLREIEKSHLDRVKRIYGVQGDVALQDASDLPESDVKVQELVSIEEEKAVTSKDLIQRKGEIDKIVK